MQCINILARRSSPTLYFTIPMEDWSLNEPITGRITMFIVCCSLLDILAGRKDKIGLSGHVLVDGAIQPDNFKCMSGYVIQVRMVVKIEIYIGLSKFNHFSTTGQCTGPAHYDVSMRTAI